MTKVSNNGGVIAVLERGRQRLFNNHSQVPLTPKTEPDAAPAPAPAVADATVVASTPAPAPVQGELIAPAAPLYTPPPPYSPKPYSPPPYTSPGYKGYTPPPPAPQLPELKADETFVGEHLGTHELDLRLLFDILSFRRCHGSKGEEAFIDQLLLPRLGKMKHEFTVFGPNGKPEMGNIIVFVKEPIAGNVVYDQTMFSCHIDTCHSDWPKDAIRQKLAVDRNMEHVFVQKSDNNADCLGADDGAGVWILLEMIRYGIPGTYVFHRGEEKGCIGSHWMFENKKDFLKTFKRAIAFDRKGDFEVITKQRGEVCCSDEFALEIGVDFMRFNKLEYKPSPNGSYTDTASYTSIIPECTNIGVGYEDAHGRNESLNYAHIQQLLIACLQTQWHLLPTKRKPVAEGARWENSRTSNNGHGYGGYRGNGFGGHDFMTGEEYEAAMEEWRKHEEEAARETAAKSGKKDKSNKDSKKGSVAATPPPPPPAPLRRSIPADGYFADDFEGQTRDEIYQVLEDLYLEDINATVINLLEEIEGLRAQLLFRRRLT
jgi:hypothetical protein